MNTKYIHSKIILVGTIFLLCLFFGGCNAPSSRTLLKRLRNVDLNQFKSISLFVRTRNADGVVIFAYEDVDDSLKSRGPFVVTLDADEQILFASGHLLQDSSTFDKKRVLSLIPTFMGLKLAKLKVTNGGCAFLGQSLEGGFQLAKLVSEDCVQKSSNEWKLLEGSWFERSNSLK